MRFLGAEIPNFQVFQLTRGFGKPGRLRIGAGAAGSRLRPLPRIGMGWGGTGKASSSSSSSSLARGRVSSRILGWILAYFASFLLRFGEEKGILGAPRPRRNQRRRGKGNFLWKKRFFGVGFFIFLAKREACALQKHLQPRRSRGRGGRRRRPKTGRYPPKSRRTSTGSPDPAARLCPSSFAPGGGESAPVGWGCPSASVAAARSLGCV